MLYETHTRAVCVCVWGGGVNKNFIAKENVKHSNYCAFVFGYIYISSCLSCCLQHAMNTGT
jgi:hypothetical protein